MTDPGTYCIETLGCKSNFYDSRRLAESLEALGYREARPEEAPDLCLVNTCTVTAVADRKSRQRAARLVRKHPQARVFVTGCYASAAPAEPGRIPGVAGAYGLDRWDDLFAAITGGGAPAAGPRGDFGILTFGGRARAFLKVQDGCDCFCSYCILPRVRGKPRSRPLAEVKAEATRLAAAGFAEIVLTGIHLGFYGRDLPGRPSLARALAAVAEAPGVGRVRLSSVECNEVDGALLKAMGHPAACPHLHLPLQSGDPAVLERMNRRYTPGEFMTTVELARQRLDRPAVTTDVIVGFPGETDAQFENTLEFCRAAAFSRIHVFPFSPRPGTAAAEMPDRVPAPTVRERSRRLRTLANRMAAGWAQGFVGRQVRALFERRSADGHLSGYTDRYVRLLAPGGGQPVGRIRRVRCVECRGISLVGERVEGESASSG